MKSIFILFLFLLSTHSKAPDTTVLYIQESQKIQVFDPILYAFMKVESNFQTDVINSLGYAGILQIGPEMIEETNRICELTGNPKSFTLTDRLDSIKSVQIWYIIQNYYNRAYTLENACKLWNPLAGDWYYNKIKRYL
jgi:hypothetical protein